MKPLSAQPQGESHCANVDIKYIHPTPLRLRHFRREIALHGLDDRCVERSNAMPFECLVSLVELRSSSSASAPHQALDVTRRKTKSAKSQDGTEINARRDGFRCVPIIASKNRSNPSTWSRERARQRRQKEDLVDQGSHSSPSEVSTQIKNSICETRGAAPS